MKFLIVIPARKGSSFTGKNMFPILGKPMIGYTMDAVKCIDAEFKQQYPFDVLVTTDDHYVKAEAEIRGFLIHERAEKLADAKATLDEVMVEIVKTYPGYDFYACLPPTSPLRNQKHIKEAMVQIVAEQADSLISCYEEHKSIWAKTGRYAVPIVERSKNRQEVDPSYIANGAIFISRGENIKKNRVKVSGRVSVYEMGAYESIVDVHGREDILMAEKMMRGRE